MWCKDVVCTAVCRDWWDNDHTTPCPSRIGPQACLFPMIPFFDVQRCHMDAEVSVLQGSHKIEGNNVEGALCIKCATPGSARGIYGNSERYLAG